MATNNNGSGCQHGTRMMERIDNLQKQRLEDRKWLGDLDREVVAVRMGLVEVKTRVAMWAGLGGLVGGGVVAIVIKLVV